MPTDPPGRRLTDAELAQSVEPGRLPNLFRPLGPLQTPEQEKRTAFRNKTNQYLKDEGAVVVLQSGNVGDAGIVFGQAGGSRDPKDPVPPPMVVVTPEHYNRVVRPARRRSSRFARRRRDPRRPQERRDRYAGRASRFLARRHRRYG